MYVIWWYWFSAALMDECGVSPASLSESVRVCRQGRFVFGFGGSLGRDLRVGGQSLALASGSSVSSVFVG